MKSFIKWAGGKTRLLKKIKTEFPNNINEITTYIEPFVGAGSVFLDVLENNMFDEYIINDINERLILTYIVLKENAKELIQILKQLTNDFLKMKPDSAERQDYYYKIRQAFNSKKENNIKIAAYFIFLNKTCFNGLYRENLKGEFNVPIGKYTCPTIFDEKHLLSISKLLNTKNNNGEFKVKILCGDYTNILKYINNKTLVYLDPPYRPITKGGFISYNSSKFNDKNQTELKIFADILNKKGCKIILSNSNPKNYDVTDIFFENLYGSYYIKEIESTHSISCKNGSRGKISELLIKNF